MHAVHAVTFKLKKIYTYVANSAMVTGLHVVLTIVTSVHELIGSLIVQFVQHAQCAELSATQRRELVVLVSRHR